MGNASRYIQKRGNLIRQIVENKAEIERTAIEKAEGRNPTCPGEAVLREFYNEMAQLFKGKPLTECSKYTKMNDNAIIVATITNPDFVAEAVKSTPKDLKNIAPIVKALCSLDKRTQKSILETIYTEFEHLPISLTKTNHSCLVRRAALANKLGNEANQQAFNNTRSERE